ncbi:MAG: cystathionine beta-synthase [Fidelibacterota bacterium]
MKIAEDITELIGNTPLVRLKRVVDGVKARMYAKLEFFNPGGSVKDRIAVTIIEDAERRGELRPGGTIVEATSGNTGVALAIAAAVRGYKVTCVMPDKMSNEKIQLLRAFGSRVIITPTAVAPEDPRSYYSVAKRIVRETPGAFYANQYFNPQNPLAHYETTGPEIWEQTSGKVDVVVAGMGTGGTISGAARFLKEKKPDVKVVGADPMGSIYYEYFKTGVIREPHVYKVEGIGEDFLPETMDFNYVDEVIRISDRESFLTARRLAREEGIFAGGSSGTAVAAAIKYSRDLPADKTVVVILPDSGYRYLSKMYSDDWMRENLFLEGLGRVKDVLAVKSPIKLITARTTDRVADVIKEMKKYDISQIPVVDDGSLVGIITEVDLLNFMLEGEHNVNAPIADIVNREIAVVEGGTSLEVLSEIFSAGNVAIVVDKGQVVDIITKIDLIDYLASRS